MRNAVTIALLDENLPADLRNLMMRTWVEQKNFGAVDFQSLRRLVVPGVETILDVAETYWLDRWGGSYIDEVFVKAITNEYEGNSATAEKIRFWCALWLGTYWADPLKGTVLNYDPNDPDVDDRQTQTRRRAEEWKSVESQLEACPGVREVDAEGAFWLACRVIGILSYNSPATSTRALTAWAISRAIMDHAPEFDQVAWMLRLCPDSDAIANVHDAAESFAALDTDVARRAAGNLFSALGTPEAAQRAHAIGKERKRRELSHGFAWVPEGQTEISWDYEGARSKRTDPDSLLFFARDLGPFAVNPNLSLSDQDIRQLKDLAERVDVSQIFDGRARTGADLDLENAEPALARWVPNELAALYGRLFATAQDRVGEDLNQLGFETPSRLFVLSENERSILVDIGKSMNPKEKHDEHAVRTFLLADLPGKNASQQIKTLKRWPNGPVFNEECSSLLAVPNKRDFENVENELKLEHTRHWLCAWLWYVSHAPLDNLPSGYAPLVPLFEHPDGVVRTHAFEVVNASGDSALAAAVWRSGWQPTTNTKRPETLAGSSAMLRCIERGVSGSEIRPRISRDLWGHLAMEESATADDMDAFADMVRERLNEDLSPNPPSRSFGGYQVAKREPIERLVAWRGQDVARWIQPFLDDYRKISTSAFMDAYPYMDICSALFQHQPERGARFWQALQDKARETPFSNSGILELPFLAPESEAVLELRDEALEATTTDAELEGIAMALVRTNQEDWLRDRIQRDLQGKTAVQLALGLTLAGLLPPNPASDALWQGTLARSPGRGWLADVHAWARRRYDTACWAAHWLDAFFSEPDRERAFGYHVLFQRCFARHHVPWVVQQRDAAWSNLSHAWRSHWGLCAENLKKRADNQRKNSESTLFGTKITSQVQWPWR
jgi:hypothetical protein